MTRIRTFGGNFELHTCADSYHNFWTANLKIPIQRRGHATGATIEILFSIGGILAYVPVSLDLLKKINDCKAIPLIIDYQLSKNTSRTRAKQSASCTYL